MRMLPEGKSQRGIFLIVIKTESVKATQLKETGSAAATPFKGIESVHSIPFYNTESHQPLYSEKIFTQKISKNWKGFNS